MCTVGMILNARLVEQNFTLSANELDLETLFGQAGGTDVALALVFPQLDSLLEGNIIAAINVSLSILLTEQAGNRLWEQELNMGCMGYRRFKTCCSGFDPLKIAH